MDMDKKADARSPVPDLALLIKNLEFAEEEVASAATSQAKFFIEASRYSVSKMRELMRADAALTEARAECAIEIRNQGVQPNGKPVTDSYIAEQIDLNPDVAKAKAEADMARAANEFARLLLEAYRMRSSAIKVLAEILGAEAASDARAQREELALAAHRQVAGDVRRKYAKQPG